MTTKELLKEAERRYPVGTTFMSVHRVPNKGRIVAAQFYISDGDIVCSNTSGTGCTVYNIKFDKWAEVIEEPKEATKVTKQVNSLYEIFN